MLEADLLFRCSLKEVVRPERLGSRTSSLASPGGGEEFIDFTEKIPVRGFTAYTTLIGSVTSVCGVWSLSTMTAKVTAHQQFNVLQCRNCTLVTLSYGVAH